MTTTIDLQGLCDQRFGAVRDAFAENFARGLEIGASVCITWNGKTVVDLWAGSADAACTTPWLGLDNRIALGYMLPSPMRRFSDNPQAFGYAGAGGSLGFADPENRLSFGYAMNQMQGGGPGGDSRWWGLIQGMYDAVDVPYTPPSGSGQGTSVG
jgi:CubicO group peptidase (beta-lactamase class C family)